jgi:cyclopropane fatty-acyl-phospholipid synthase-like methyltransferase
MLETAGSVLEIGSGTGQHAVYFASMMPHLQWYTSDCASYLQGINLWVAESGLGNVHAPFELNVSSSNWPILDVDAIFSANSLHIMSEYDADNMIAGSGSLLKSQGSLIIYGPFNYHGEYTSESNRRFDGWLKDRDPESGIKDFEWINTLAERHGLTLAEDCPMPANNRILHFSKL